MASQTRVVSAALLAFALTACSPAAPHAPSQAAPEDDPGPLDNTTVVVDPGHNGGNAEQPDTVEEPVDIITDHKPCNTTGAHTANGYAEHEFNFEVAGLVSQRLEAAGATVVTTRDSDDGVGPCIDERAEVGNDLDADMVLSIHADGGPSSGRGFHIMEPKSIDHNDHIVEPSQELAQSLATTLNEDTPLPPSDYIGQNGINPRDDMGGLNLSSVPAVMAECGNMENATDAELLEDPDFRDTLAEALTAGATEFLLD